MSSEEDFPEDGGFSPGASPSHRQQATPPDASEDLQCSICLSTLDNTAYVTVCMHRFCFGCIRQLSATRAECPLCQRPFRSVLHRAQADDDYQEYRTRRSSAGRRGGKFCSRSAARRARSRSPRRDGDGPSRVQHTRGYDSLARSRWRRSRAQRMAPAGGWARPRARGRLRQRSRSTGTRRQEAPSLGWHRSRSPRRGDELCERFMVRAVCEPPAWWRRQGSVAPSDGPAPSVEMEVVALFLVVLCNMLLLPHFHTFF